MAAPSRRNAVAAGRGSGCALLPGWRPIRRRLIGRGTLSGRESYAGGSRAASAKFDLKADRRKMANWSCLAMSVGLLFAPFARAQGRTAVQSAASRHVELSEAFPWDESVEQAYTGQSALAPGHVGRGRASGSVSRQPSPVNSRHPRDAMTKR